MQPDYTPCLHESGIYVYVGVTLSRYRCLHYAVASGRMTEKSRTTSVKITGRYSMQIPAEWCSRDTLVGKASKLRAGRPRGRWSSPVIVKNCLFSTSSRTVLASTQRHIQWVQGVIFQREKTAEAWNWPLTSISCQSQEWCSYTSFPPYVFMAWCLIN
jgi:hypothetical protein